MPTDREIYNSKLKAELEKWRVLGIDPDTWMPSGGMLSIVMRLDVLSEILVEAGVLDMEVADQKMRVKALERLEGIRKELEPQIAEARLQAIKNGRLYKQ